MHPAWSVIVFTVLSGFGFGMMFWVGLGAMDVSGVMAFSVVALSMGLAIIGLLSSTLHLGHPERAWKAFSQWRSSWLSREGVVSVAALLAFGLYGLIWITGGERVGPLGVIASALSMATVFCTAMIYTQLKTVPRWNSEWTPLLFVLFALAVPGLVTGVFVPAAGLLVALGWVQWQHWKAGDVGLAAAGTPESATGLGHLGEVRLLEAPNSSPNYLNKEMMHQVARKRAGGLRRVAMVAGVLVPLLIALGLAFGGVHHGLLLVAFAVHLIGAMASRWLFFAEAEHVVGLYYGRR